MTSLSCHLFPGGGNTATKMVTEGQSYKPGDIWITRGTTCTESSCRGLCRINDSLCEATRPQLSRSQDC